MERRVTLVVAMFVGGIALLGTWLLLTTDPTVPSSRTAATTEERPAPVPEDAAAVMERLRDARTGRIDPRSIGSPGSRELLDDRRMLPPGLRGRALRPGGSSLSASGVYTLDSNGATNAVATRQAELDACYRTALLHAPDLPASMSLSLEVAPAPDQPFDVAGSPSGQPLGQVTAVEAAGVQDASVFESCATGALGNLRFTTEEPSTVTVPVVLDRAG